MVKKEILKMTKKKTSLVNFAQNVSSNSDHRYLLVGQELV